MFKSISDLPVVAVEQWHPNDPLSVKQIKRWPDVGFNHDNLVRVRDVATLMGMAPRDLSSNEVTGGDEMQMAIAYLEKVANETEDQSKLGKANWCRECARALRERWFLTAPASPAGEPNRASQLGCIPDAGPKVYDLVHIGCGGVAFRYSKQLAVGDAIHPSEVTMVDGGSGLDAHRGHLLCGSCGDLLVAHHVRATGPRGWMGVTLPTLSTPAAETPSSESQSGFDG